MPPDLRSTHDQHRPRRLHHAYRPRRHLDHRRRAVTVPFEFEGLATDPFGNLRAGFEGAVTINRKDYGITWHNVMDSGGLVVSDEVKVLLQIQAGKPKAK